MKTLTLLRFPAAFLCSLLAVWAQIALPQAKVGVDYQCQVAADPAPEAGSIFSAEGLPAGLSISGSTGVISGRPATAGTYALVLKIMSASTTDSFDATLVVASPTGTPVITSATQSKATVGKEFVYDASANPTALLFNADPIPEGLSLDATSGRIYGVPSSAGTYKVNLSANNEAGTGPLTLFSLMVEPANPLPQITENATISVSQSGDFSHQISVDGTATSFTAEGLPAGLSIDTTTGRITGRATTAGVWYVTIRASNSYGTGTARTVTLAVGDLPIINSASSLTTVVNRSIGYFQFNATQNPISFNVHGLPNGLTVDTLTGQLQGTPPEEGVFVLTVSANNVLGTGPESSLTLNVVHSTESNNSPLACFAARAWADGNANIENTFITGFLISGPGTRQLLLRGVGPGLSAYGVHNAMLDPKIRLFGGDGSLLLENDNWGDSSELSAAFVKAGLPALDAGSKDAATLVTLAPGAYTLHVTAPVGVTGVALTEVYDISSNTTSASEFFRGFASRCRVINEEGMAIGGFIIGGTQTKRVLIRGLGPELAKSGVVDYLIDPVIRIFGGNGAFIAQNDQWDDQSSADGTTQERLTPAQISAICRQCDLAELASGSKDAAMVVDLPPGGYTVHVNGAAGKVGVALIEIYVVPE